ncbi:MAG: helix-turn-helix transcriptional regulator [Oscillatoriales cyanobacterium RM2_1_1]|nr:helix-turn-helix transcriptional regulator [Oscillatoriales cyanobacterium RM2_1_1]
MNTGAPVTLHQTVDQRSETITSVPGDMGIYPAHLWQTFHWHQPAEFLQLYLEPMLLTHLGRELWGKDQIELIPQLASCFDPLIYQMAIALKTTLETDGIGSKLYADSMANALAVHLLCRYSAHQSLPRQDSGRLSQQQLRQVIDYIDENLDQNLSLSQLASIAHLSSYHFARLFKQSTGTPPHRYHIQRRIERAKQLLMAKELSIAEVAQVVGFASQAHLTYHFKRVVGVTPRVFVQQ